MENKRTAIIYLFGGFIIALLLVVGVSWVLLGSQNPSLDPTRLAIISGKLPELSEDREKVIQAIENIGGNGCAYYTIDGNRHSWCNYGTIQIGSGTILMPEEST